MAGKLERATFFNSSVAPSPRRVRIFLAEKGVQVDTVEVAIREGEQFTAEFKAVNPRCVVPALKLDDGTCIAEASVICRYVEEVVPEPDLLGATPAERGVVAMWDKYMENEGFAAVAEGLRNSAPRFENRALTGPVDYAQMPELAERGRVRTRHYFDDLDARLGESEFVAGPRFTIADITAFVTVEFAEWVEVRMEDRHANLARWYATVSARPSSKA